MSCIFLRALPRMADNCFGRNRLYEQASRLHEQGSRMMDDSESEDSLIIDSDDDKDDKQHKQDGKFQICRSISKMTPNSSEFDSYDDLRIQMENKNTQRKTDTDIRIIISYLRSVNETRNPEDVSPHELDRYLSTFFTIVKKHDGNDYEPASLRGMLCSVERYLKSRHYQTSVTRDPAFSCTRQALKFKQQKLREIGKGVKKPNEPLCKGSLEKVNQLFTEQELGPHTPMSVINTLCFMIIVHFRLRKAIDHKNLLWGDIKLKSDSKGSECLVYQPISTVSQPLCKSSRENQSRFCIVSKPELKDRDPVSIYKLYTKKRPLSMQYENSPFYLGITSLNPTPMQSWYRTCAMGVNKLSDLVRMIRALTGLPRAALDDPAESLVSENYRIPPTTCLPYSYKPITPVPSYTPIIPKSEEKVAVKDELVTYTNLPDDSMLDKEFDGETPPHSPSICDISSPESEHDSAKSAITKTCDKITLQEAKRRVTDIAAALNKSEIPDFENWLKQQRFPKETLETSIRSSQHNGNSFNYIPLPEDQKAKTATITLSLKLDPLAVKDEDILTITSVVSSHSSNEKSVNGSEKIQSDASDNAKNEDTKLDDISNKRDIDRVDGVLSQDSPPPKKQKPSESSPVNLTSRQLSETNEARGALINHVDIDGCGQVLLKPKQNTPFLSLTNEDLTHQNHAFVPSVNGFNGVPQAHMVPSQQTAHFTSRDPNWAVPMTYPMLFPRNIEGNVPMTAHCSYTQYQFAQSLQSANSCQFQTNI